MGGVGASVLSGETEGLERAIIGQAGSRRKQERIRKKLMKKSFEG